jgi:hypothetical protein
VHIDRYCSLMNRKRISCGRVRVRFVVIHFFVTAANSKRCEQKERNQSGYREAF